MVTWGNTTALSEAYDNLLNTVSETKIYITTGHRIIYGAILNPGTVIRLHNSTSEIDPLWLLSNHESSGALGGRWVNDEGYSCDVYTMLHTIVRGNLKVEVIFNPNVDM